MSSRNLSNYTTIDYTSVKIDYSVAFTKPLVEWYRINKRPLPWRQTTDPYKIWLSEVMLQQTRVDQATPYYHRFLEAFPTVFDLANADSQDVLRLWEGLGYYSRARNLHQAAKTIASEYKGIFPDSLQDALKLKGVGDYTAAAVLSIAYNKQHAVVDGNVIRVICRFLGISDDVREVSTRQYIQKMVSEWIPADAPADFNQAMMELGATICTPHNPDCSNCPISRDCRAVNTARTDVIPYKSPAKKVPHHTIVVGIIVDEIGKVLIARRPEKAMLGGLWEFPGGKVEKDESFELALQRELLEELGVEAFHFEELHKLKHAYSHFKITLHAYTCRIKSGVPTPHSSDEIRWVRTDELHDYPFPKANRTLTKILVEKANVSEASVSENSDK
jgi:A/G-specific adenine glycosylase